LTTSDYLNVVQYYWQNPSALEQVDQFRLNSLRDIERAIGVTPIETVSIHPLQPLYEACRRMLESRARRIPLIDKDDETQREMVVSVITQYRILKFISVNVKETQSLRKPLRDLNVGSYDDIATATMDTPVMDCIHMLVKKSISSIPILDVDGTVLNVFEAVDVIALIKGGDYENLNLSVGKALDKRSDVRFR
jgi:CBS domain-containing protein